MIVNQCERTLAERFDLFWIRIDVEVNHRLRAEGLSVELYPDAAKLKKQFKHANDRGARWTVVIGEAELESGKLALKDMEGGEQWTVTLEESIQRIQEGTDAHE